jgi:hypothetical protein
MDERNEGWVKESDYTALKRQHDELLAAYEESIDDIASWGCYASDYFQQKHDFDGCLRKHNERLAIVKAGDV